jgi:molybdopterin converting factor subunit 1
MRIHVKLFSVLREKAGTDTVLLDLPEGASVAEALVALQQRCPALQPHVENVRLAVHMDFVDPTICLAEGDELTLIPPVSGGS